MFPPNPFPASEFDAWAETYDQSTREYADFPFDGYDRLLEIVVSRAEAQKGLSVLDLGTGTGNLALLFSKKGCDLWCTDFSEPMLAKARAKLPNARFVSHDLRAGWPAELERRFDCIVSAYVFHHFELEKKVSLCKELATQRLNPGAKLVIADLSFPTFAEKETYKLKFDDWEEEFYWFADEALSALKTAGLSVTYEQVSACAGVYTIRSRKE